MRIREHFLYHVVMEKGEEVTREEAHEAVWKMLPKPPRHARYYIDPKCLAGAEDAWGIIVEYDGTRVWPVQVIGELDVK